MPDILAILYFIESQVYIIDKNIIYQENQSTNKLKVNLVANVLWINVLHQVAK